MYLSPTVCLPLYKCKGRHNSWPQSAHLIVQTAQSRYIWCIDSGYYLLMAQFYLSMLLICPPVTIASECLRIFNGLIFTGVLTSVRYGITITSISQTGYWGTEWLSDLPKMCCRTGNYTHLSHLPGRCPNHWNNLPLQLKTTALCFRALWLTSDSLTKSNVFSGGMSQGWSGT